MPPAGRLQRLKMITGLQGKQYGLIKPGGPKQAARTQNVFGDDDDDEAESQLARAQAKKHSTVPEEYAQGVTALDEDVLDYDSWKDHEIESAAAEKAKARSARIAGSAASSSSGVHAGAPAQPKYISSLLQKAKEREIERDRIIERKLAREQAEEEAVYGDKEKFVTTAYRARLEERSRLEEQARRSDAADAAQDVTKRGDLNEFYRNMYKSGGVLGSQAEPAAKGAAAPAIASHAGTKATMARQREADDTFEHHGHPLPASASSTASSMSHDGGAAKRGRLDSDDAADDSAARQASAADVAPARRSRGFSDAGAASASASSHVAPLPSDGSSGTPGDSEGADVPDAGRGGTQRRPRLTPEEIEGYRERAVARYQLRSGRKGNG